MKFVFAVVVLVLATAVQSSVLPLGAWGGLGPWGGLGIHGGPALAIHAGAPWGGISPVALGIPGIALSQGPGPLGAPLALGHGLGHGLGLGLGLGHEGVYVAKTRGAIHTAPLAGHISSATSVNVAPAPGTI